MTGEAVPCTSEQSQLGEGVRWDARRDELIWVDILAGRVFRARAAADGGLIPLRTYELPGPVGAIAPIEGDDGWLLAFGRGLAHLSLHGDLLPIADLCPEGIRMNDAACDPQGRFWAGSVSQVEGAATLYRLGPDGRVDVMLTGLTTSNGLGWSPDGRTMYHTDSGPRVVRAFDFDPGPGTISNGRTLIQLDEAVGAPDGLSVDANGDLWVAIWGAGRIHRYSPSGAQREALAVPATQTTCCAFGTPALHQLYVTTATEHWTDEQRRADPAAGLVYRFATDAKGQPAAPFRPDPAWWTNVVS